jgi:hypothetical protein
VVRARLLVEPERRVVRERDALTAGVLRFGAYRISCSSLRLSVRPSRVAAPPRRVVVRVDEVRRVEVRPEPLPRVTRRVPPVEARPLVDRVRDVPRLDVERRALAVRRVEPVVRLRVPVPRREDELPLPDLPPDELLWVGCPSSPCCFITVRAATSFARLP